MKSLWNDKEARRFLKDPLDLRVYTSRLLGADSRLVLHGGGNTSVKTEVRNLFGEMEEVLYVKGSGWDLATIEREGFAPVKMNVLLKMAELKALKDTEMVSVQRSAMINPAAPNPSVEAILHAIIPFTYVDHTHSDVVVTITNTKDGRKRIEELYGPNMIIIDYVMPGFQLAKKVFDETKKVDWKKVTGIVLMNHGIFTFDDDAKRSYEKMIKLVTQAEKYLKKQNANYVIKKASSKPNLLQLVQMRRSICESRQTPVLATLLDDDKSLDYANRKNISFIASRGPLTPDHVIRVKRIPMILNGNILKSVSDYEQAYAKYFKQHASTDQKCLDLSPRWAIWPSYGCVAFGRNIKEVNIIKDITEHSMEAVVCAEKLGGWRALPAEDIFDVEYWDLEQAKLKKGGSAPLFQGKVAVVTGAASGIGKACVEQLLKQGASILALDIDKKITSTFPQNSVLGVVCDLTKQKDVVSAIAKGIKQFGGIDILMSNAGIFPEGETLECLNEEIWQKSLDVNLSSHQRLIKQCIPFLKYGIDASIIIVASKNVPAPGYGAGAYSVAKAGLTQLSRIAALELAKDGIRVNVIHPNQIFDTGIWTDSVLKNRAKHYGLSVEEYKTNNLLKVEIVSKDVANLACTMAGPVFAKTTGAQVPIDGGNERVI